MWCKDSAASILPPLSLPSLPPSLSSLPTPEEGNTPSFQYSTVECVLFAFHNLVQKVSLCHYLPPFFPPSLPLPPSSLLPPSLLPPSSLPPFLPLSLPPSLPPSLSPSLPPPSLPPSHSSHISTPESRLPNSRWEQWQNERLQETVSPSTLLTIYLLSDMIQGSYFPES